MDTSIYNLYERIATDGETVPAFDEMLFYTGSPTADIVVVSEAPTTPNSPDDHTLYHTVTEEKSGEPVDRIAQYLRSYPFQNHGRNDLYEQYVDRILAFCDDPEEEIGFTDLCKQPLAAFGDGIELRDVWNETPFSSRAVVEAQIRAVNPQIIVCNKKNVSTVLSRVFLGEDGYTGGWPSATWDDVPRVDATLVYSTMAHMQMSLLSRKRLSEEVFRLYQR